MNLDITDLDKRFYIFQLELYYPAGGMNDIVAYCDTCEHVLAYLEENKETEGWFEILDRKTGEYTEGGDFCRLKR